MSVQEPFSSAGQTFRLACSASIDRLTRSCTITYIHCHTMTARKRYSFWIDDAQAKGLKAVKERDGVLESEQIRRALNDWLEKRRVRRKTERPRAVTRKRS